MRRQARGTNSKLVRVHNRALVLKIIQQHESISRKNIAQITGLTRAAITMITNSLLEQEIIVERGKDTSPRSSGRKEIFLSINREKHTIIAVNFGRCLIQGAVCDLAGNIITKIEEYNTINMSLTRKSSEIEDSIVSFIRKLIRKGSADQKSIIGISIAAPGPINARKGIVLKPVRRSNDRPVPYDWSDLKLTEVIRKKFGVKVFMDNDANIAALGESWYGNGIGIDNFVLYAAGMGIGAGVIIDGMLYRGEDDVVSEVGHITINHKGPQCICGNIGCLELYAKITNLIGKAPGKRGDESIQAENERLRHGVSEIFAQANAGEPKARKKLEEYGRLLGIGAVTIANMFSPEYIIVSGNDFGDLDYTIICEEMQRSIHRHAFSVISDKVKVVQSRLGNNIMLYGGVALVLQDFFNNIES